MNKNDLRVIKTKKTIYNSLLLLLKNKPLSQIKVTELCRAAEINRGTFYFHYQEIGDVLEELFGEIMRDLEDSYAEPFKKGFTVHKKNLDPDMIKIFHHVKKHEEFYKIVLSEDASMKYYYMFYDVVCRLNMQTKYGLAGDDFLTAYSANAMIGLIIKWYRNDFNDSVDEMNQRLFHIVQHSFKKV